MFAKVFCILLVSTTIFGLPLNYDAPQEEVSQWNDYIEEHDKVYESPEEEMRRFEIFRENMKKAERQNEEHNGMTTFGATVFSDMTSEEYMKLFRTEGLPEEGFAPSTDKCRHIASKPLRSRNKSWKDIAGPVKEQGHCGSCYIFAVLAAVDAHLSIKWNENIVLSEQEVLDCGEDTITCEGGLRSDIYGYITKHGVSAEARYDNYTAHKNNCHDPYHLIPKKKITGYCQVWGGEEEIARAIDQVGPVAIGLSVGESFQQYRDGIYHSTDCDPNTTNHAMLAVGYGESPEEGKYWVIKNSHGTNWGAHGYLKIPRNQNYCGIGLNANYPIL